MSDDSKDPSRPAAAPPEPDRLALAQRLAFLGWTDADAERLRQLAPRLAPAMNEFVEAFYNHLFAFPQTAALLQDPRRVARLREKQRQHFESLLEANIDEAFVERRRQVGQAHSDEGLDPEWFLGSYFQYIEHCVRAVGDSPGADPLADQQRIVSLFRGVFLDIGLTLDAYFLQSTHRMQEALQMLWKANHELRRFAQLTSHDLKTPLATVANLCDEVLDEFGPTLPSAARQLVTQARDNTFRMSTLIDELLESTGQVASAEGLDPISSREALVEAADRVRPLLEQKGIELILPHELPSVFGNHVRLREAFYNLLANAVKYIETRPGRIEVRTQASDAECEFVVADNGPGIPLDEQHRVFAPFHRLPMHRDRPGTGLGLYFTKSLIEDMGGRVWVVSEPGHGAAFHLTVPRRARPIRPGRP